MITYKGIEYPTRELAIIIDEEEIDIIISTQSLSDALGDNKELDGSDEQGIDAMIYFYVEDEAIHLDDEEIAKNHLDEPFELVEHDGVKCNNCDWKGSEEDLYLLMVDSEDEQEKVLAYEKPNGTVIQLFPDPKERSFLKGCPNCLTDSYLGDV